MMTDAVTQSRIDACLDATRASADVLARAGHDAKLLADKDLIAALAEAVRVTRLSADCLQRLPELNDMVLRVCVEISERAALACAKHMQDDELVACGEALAACAAVCAGAPEEDILTQPRPGMGAAPSAMH